MKENKTDPLRQLVTSEVIEVNVLSELSAPARVLVWELFILATCTDDKSQALNNFYEKTIRFPGDKRELSHVFVDQDGFVVPLAHWLGGKDSNTVYWSDYRVENIPDGKSPLPDGKILRALSGHELEILLKKKKQLEEHYPFKGLTNLQREKDLIIIANELGFDLSSKVYWIKPFKADQELQKMENDISLEDLREKINSTLESLKARGLLEE